MSILFALTSTERLLGDAKVRYLHDREKLLIPPKKRPTLYKFVDETVQGLRDTKKFDLLILKGFKSFNKVS